MSLLESIADTAGRYSGRQSIKGFDLIRRNFARLEPAVVDSGAADYIPVLTDGGRVVTRSRATAQTLTLPQDSAVAFPVGTQIAVIQTGAGALTFQAGAGATMNKSATYASGVAAGQYARVVATKVAANTWNVSGDLTLA